MRHQIIRSIPITGAFFILLSLLTSFNLQADMETADAAYREGNYKVTLSELRPLAEAGNPRAQYRLGVLYDEGQGVAQDRAEAARWYRKAAEQGYISAQYNLGILYYDGEGVKQELVRAYAWFDVIVTEGDLRTRVARDAVEQQMTPELLEAGKKLSAELYRKYGKKMEVKPRESIPEERKPDPRVYEPLGPDSIGEPVPGL